MLSPLAVRRLTQNTKKQLEKLAEWLDHLAINAKVATVLCLILASSAALKIEGRQMK
jgi:hypothetical protein